MKKKVVFILPSLGVGGAENMVAQLATNLDKNLFEVTVISIRSAEDTIIEEKLIRNSVKISFLNHNISPNLKGMLITWNELNRIKPDIIHTHLSAFIYTVPWIFLRGKKILHTIHSRPKYEFSRKLRIIMKMLYSLKKAVPIAISATIAKETKELYNIKKSELQVIYNPVDLSIYNKGIVSGKKNHQNITFINVARFNAVKNQEMLVEAFAKVRKHINNVNLVFVGDGELRNMIEKKVHNYGLNDEVVFTGNIQNVADKLRLADIFVLPSRYEGLPLTILEAMASGLPIVATNIGGIPDIVKGNGLLFEENDIDSMVEAMSRLALDAKLRNYMGEMSIKYVKPYNIDSIVDQYQCLYKRYC